MNKVSVCNANNPMPTGHGEAGTKLLSPSRMDTIVTGNKKHGSIMAHAGACRTSITSGFVIRVDAKS